MPASFATEKASTLQKSSMLLVMAGLFVAGLTALDFAGMQLPALPPVVPAFATAVVVESLITSSLVAAQFRLMRAPSFAILAAGYLFIGLMAGAQMLIYPGIATEYSLFTFGPQSAAWLWLLWHGGFPLFAIGFAIVERWLQGLRLSEQARFIVLVTIVIAIPILVAALVALVSTNHLMPLLNTVGLGQTIYAWTVMTLCATAFVSVVVATRLQTVADFGLTIAVLALLLDSVLSLNCGSRYSLGWYAGRACAVVSSSAVLLVFLREVTQLYARAVTLNVSLERMALLDGLTGLANRRHFDERLAAEWSGALRRRSSIGMLMIDVDFFKRYNDRYGHLAGDEALRQVASAIRNSAKRSTDFPARYGGEEFAVVLPDTELPAGLQLAEAIRAAIRRSAIPHSGNPPSHLVSVSIGLAAIVPRGPYEADILTKAADQALYAAKHQGRDRVVVGQVNFPDVIPFGRVPSGGSGGASPDGSGRVTSPPR